MVGLGAPAATSAVWAGDVFTVDTNQSSIALSGSVLGFTLQEQGAGSLTTTFAGTLNADVTDTTIQFTGQSLLAAQNNGSWQPKADGSAGSEPANYGAQASSVLGNAVAALRQIQLDATSPSLSLTNGQFDSGSLTFFFPVNAPSTLAYTVSGFLLNKSGSLALTGYSTNKVTTLASLATVGGQQILTIPVNAQYFFTLVSANDTTVSLKGQLVATRAASVPLTIQSITVQTQVVTLQWQSAPGQLYQVQSSTDLTHWTTNAANVTSPTNSYSWSGAAAAPNGFFRLAQ
jgi:hypothetical protein